MTILTREQFEQTLIEHVDVDDAPYVALLAHDAAQRQRVLDLEQRIKELEQEAP